MHARAIVSHVMNVANESALWVYQDKVDDTMNVKSVWYQEEQDSSTCAHYS